MFENLFNKKFFIILSLFLLILIGINIISFNNNDYILSNPKTQELIRNSLEIENLSHDKSSYNKPSISLYFAKWCGHCVNFKPTWEQIKNELNNSNIDVNTIDCSGDSPHTSINETPNGTQLEGFPTIILSINKKDIIYNGERSKMAVISFIKQNM